MFQYLFGGKMEKDNSACELVSDYSVEELTVLVLSSPWSENMQTHLVSCQKHSAVLEQVKWQIFLTFCPNGSSMPRQKAHETARRFQLLGFHP